MIELRKVIKDLLNETHLRVYFQLAPEETQTPYLTYDLTEVTDDGEGFQPIALDVDGWDIPTDGDTTALETLMEAVNENLNKRSVITETMVGTFYLDRKIQLQDEDKRIKRRKYIYEARLFGRS